MVILALIILAKIKFVSYILQIIYMHELNSVIG